MNVLLIFVVMVVVAIGTLALRRARGGSVPPLAERRQWVVDEFSRRKVRQWLLGIPLGAVVVPLLWARHHPLQGFMPLLCKRPPPSPCSGLAT